MRWKTAWLFCSGRSARRMRTSTTCDAELLRLAVELLADARHQRGAVVAHDVREASPRRARGASAELSRVESCELARSSGADRLVEAQRIGDPVAREGVDHEPLLVGGDDLLRRVLEVEDALVDLDDGVDQAAP